MLFNRRNPRVASLLLRAGLAAVFVYAAIASLRYPLEWEGYLPVFLGRQLSPLLLIRLVAVYELVVALWLVSGKYLRPAALLTAVTLAGIMLSNLTQMAITFRDIGLFFAALALVFLDTDKK